MSAVSRGRAWAVAGWLRSASLLVPAEARAEWQRRYRAQWAAIGILESRGELPGASRTACLWLCRDAKVKAVGPLLARYRQRQLAGDRFHPGA